MTFNNRLIFWKRKYNHIFLPVKIATWQGDTHFQQNHHNNRITEDPQEHFYTKLLDRNVPPEELPMKIMKLSLLFSTSLVLIFSNPFNICAEAPRRAKNCVYLWPVISMLKFI